MKKNPDLLTQPRMACDKKLYNRYKSMLKALGKNVMQYNQLLFENAMERELDAFEKGKQGDIKPKLISET